MNGKYEAAAIAVKNAEHALETLKEFADIQYKAKGETMREQIANYIADVLADANYMLYGGCLYGNLSLSRVGSQFAFNIIEGSIGQFSNSIFYININGDIHYRCELRETYMLAIITNWDEFKQELDRAIKSSLRHRTERINNTIAHIAHVNEQLSKWQV